MVRTGRSAQRKMSAYAQFLDSLSSLSGTSPKIKSNTKVMWEVPDKERKENRFLYVTLILFITNLYCRLIHYMLTIYRFRRLEINPFII